MRTGIDVRVLWKLCCTWTVLKEALGCVAMVTAWGCSGESAFVLSSLDTSAVVTTGVLDFWEKRWTLLPRNLALKLLHNYNHFLLSWTKSFIFSFFKPIKHLIPPGRRYFYMTSQMPGVATRQVMNNQNWQILTFSKVAKSYL